MIHTKLFTVNLGTMGVERLVVEIQDKATLSNRALTYMFPRDTSMFSPEVETKVKELQRELVEVQE